MGQKTGQPKDKPPTAHKKSRRSITDMINDTALNPRQSRFAIAFAKSRLKTQAAVIAGYKGPPAQAGYQAFKALQKKAPEVIAAMGITLESIIENHLLPKLNAQETKIAQHEGEFTDFVDVDDHRIQLDATKTMLELMDVYSPKDQVLAAQMGVKVVVIDVARPDYSNLVNVTPRNKLIDQKPVRPPHSPRKAVESAGDPRPKD